MHPPPPHTDAHIASQGESAKDATEVKAVSAIGGAVCGTVFAALTLAGSPITIIANVLKLIQGKCKWFGDPKKNMAITIGTTGGVGVDAAVGAAIGGGLVRSPSALLKRCAFTL